MAKQNYVLLNRITTTTAVSSVTFSSIPQTGYTDLKIIVSGRSTGTDGTSPWTGINLAFNGVSTNQSAKRLLGTGSSVTSESGANLGGFVAGNIATAKTFGNSEIYILNYTSTSPKSVYSDAVTENNAVASMTGIVAGLWNPAVQAPITTIALSCANGNFDVGSSFSLYGIANVSATPTSSPKAFGGDIIKTDGTYWYHAFLSSGAFVPQTNLSCDYLIVGGGGGGTYGGGGSGGLKSSSGNGGGGAYIYSPLSLNANQSYTATVGAGGSAGTNTSSVGASNGTTSSFNIWSGIGGGRGGIFVAPVSENGQSGGSGGGGGGADTGNTPGSGGSGVVGHGYGGGSGVAINTTNGGGGGGGAMAPGDNATASSFGGQGGIGKSLSDFASATGTGASGYYAGGGSGGGSSSRAGGLGGGGAGGAASSAGSSAIKNTGGGGGGGGNTTGGLSGGAGGSGIVILRYPV